VLDSAGNELEFRGWIYRDLLRPIAELDAMGNVIARYVYADGEGARQNGVSQLSTRLGANQDTSLPSTGSNVPELIELLSSSGAVTQRLRLITNQVGTVEAVVDVNSSAILQRVEYDEFGRVLFDSNPGLQPFGFAGGLADIDTRLVRFGARDYDPGVARWTSRDPVRFQEPTPNQMSYVSNDPINRTDANGLISQIDHCMRNRLNRCPRKEPSNSECGPNNQQDFKKTKYPGVGEKYRSPDGSECAYDDKGDLLPDDGSYSYNYGTDPLSSDHIVKDVIPDLLWGKCYAGGTTVY